MERCVNVYPVGLPPAAAIDTTLIKSTLRATMASIDSLGVGATNGGLTFWDLLGKVSSTRERWIPGVVGGFDEWSSTSAVIETMTFDAVHCVPIAVTMGTTTHVTTVETPRYFSALDTYSTPSRPDYPDGLTEAALSAWCTGSTTCTTQGDIRYPLCTGISLSFHSKRSDNHGSCVLRRAADTQYEDKVRVPPVECSRAYSDVCVRYSPCM